MNTLAEFMRLHGLLPLFERARKYLPSLPSPDDVVVVPWEDAPCNQYDTAVACAWKSGGRLHLSFREHIPSTLVFLHELIHLAGGGELEAYNYLPALWYAVRVGLPPFDLLSLREVDIETLDRITNDLFGMPTLDLLVKFAGVIPSMCVDVATAGGTLQFKWREDLDDREKGQCLLAQVLRGLDYNDPYSVSIFNSLVTLLRTRRS